VNYKQFKTQNKTMILLDTEYNLLYINEIDIQSIKVNATGLIEISCQNKETFSLRYIQNGYRNIEAIKSLIPVSEQYDWTVVMGKINDRRAKLEKNNT
jgi:hypothetical protein